MHNKIKLSTHYTLIYFQVYTQENCATNIVSDCTEKLSIFPQLSDHTYLDISHNIILSSIIELFPW